MESCKQCGTFYNTGYPLCPKCTDAYNSAYGYASLSKLRPKKRISSAMNFTSLILFSLLSSLGLIVAIGFLQVYIPVVWSFYYVFVGVVIGKIVTKYGYSHPLFSLGFGIVITALTFYLSDVFSIGLANQINWFRLNEYRPSIWYVALSMYTVTPSSIFTLLFKAMGIFAYWQNTREIHH